jgi:imidazole glycerol-phosphate synthase subunit HisH
VIAIVDYGAGNINSVKKALAYLGAEATLTDDPAVVAAADKVIVPGVGHFSRCRSLNDRLRPAVLEAIAKSKPFLGICVGMQWLFEGSTESPETAGAGLFPGACLRFPSEVKSPHVGWNQLEVFKDSRLLRGISSASFVYYTHSYRAPLGTGTVASTDYGGKFAAAVERDNIFGVQFHPEKSGETGLKLLENFLAL